MRIWGCKKYQGGQWWAGADAEAKQPSHNKCSWSFPRPISWPRSRPRLRSSLIKTKRSAQFHVIEGTFGFNVTLLKLSFMKWLSLFYQTLNFTSMLQGPKNNCQNWRPNGYTLVFPRPDDISISVWKFQESSEKSASVSKSSASLSSEREGARLVEETSQNNLGSCECLTISPPEQTSAWSLSEVTENKSCWVKCQTSNVCPKICNIYAPPKKGGGHFLKVSRFGKVGDWSPTKSS